MTILRKPYPRAVNHIILILVQKCPEQFENIKATMIVKNNRLKAILMDNKQLKHEKLTLLTRQGKLKETISNKTYEWLQQVEKTKNLENIINLNEAAINELLTEKSQLKNEINILTDSETRLKNSLNNKYSNCYNNIEKLNKDLKNFSQSERSLKDSIGGYENIIKNNNSTIKNLTNEINFLRNQKPFNAEFAETLVIHQNLINCTKIVNELRQQNLELKNIINN